MGAISEWFDLERIVEDASAFDMVLYENENVAQPGPKHSSS